MEYNNETIELLRKSSSIIRDMLRCSTSQPLSLQLQEMPLTKEQLNTVVSYLEKEDKSVFYSILYEKKGLLGLFELLNIADFLNVQEIIVDTCKKIEEVLLYTPSDAVRKHLKETDTLNEEHKRSLYSSYEWL